MKRILVTGAGALLGQGILRSLQISENKYHIITADPDYRAQGHSLGDKAYLIPMANDTQYLPAVEDIIQKEQVDVLLIGTDVELPIFAENKQRLEEQYNTKVIVSSVDVINIANDKWLTAEFLKENGFPYPMSAMTTDKEAIEALRNNCAFPFIAKPVDGARSKGIKIIENEQDLQEVCSYPNNLVVQEMIGEQEGEFTAGCMVVDGKCRAIVSLKRDLRDGNTYRAYRDGDNPYDTIICSIAEKLGVEGPANFQYRIKDGKPIVFEINGRFSGTTPLRYMFGFNEVEALLNHLFGVEEMTQPKLRDGAVFRTWSDIFVEPAQLNELKENGVLENYSSQYFPFKNKPS
ncbi:ATP-grasp domain-containing protein [Pontibacter toksunensis]|uniref:ATP-grasp domain-containing protein n=1 Tax=Pontibacter toksunensis TaxID=1332631 RepID=A0ABW6C1V3_9BACT